MGIVVRTATLDVREDTSDIQIMTDVKAILKSKTSDPAAKITDWSCLMTGDIGRGMTAEEIRLWFYNPQNDQTGSVSFVIGDGGAVSDVQFEIDVSGGLQEKKITIWGDFPFYLNMSGKGIVKSPGGRIANATQITYRVISIT